MTEETGIAQFPEKLKILFTAMRYKVARGGRSSGKSWGFARALLILGARYTLRILCAREVQESIKQSVHKLLKDQIQVLGLGSRYQVLETAIRGVNGTEFAFCGLSALTVESIKSYEGYDVCWVEEAQNISENSWAILIPTIRKDNSEIWISFNPDLETDPTYDRFITNPPEDILSVEMNWRDNPWFNDVMNKERLHCLATDPEGYKNIWEGKCKPAVSGAIYYKEIQKAEDEGRICNLPYDPMLKVHVVLDLGWGDSLAVSLVQKHLSEIRIIKYLEFSKTRLDVMSSELKAFHYNWGLVWLPHDGFNASLNSGGKSTYDILTALGWECAVRRARKREDIEISELSIEEGIRNVRMKFGQIYFDKTHCAGKLNPLPPEGHTLLTGRLIECLKRYRRKINRETTAETSPVHDEHSHGADNLRYICVNADKMLNVDTKKPITRINYPGYRPVDPAVGY
ncbi:MAG: PBSX family phage terminase large subunit [Deltaproteobacteria bacterium]|nr:PBSX family phage terminase large subunit [Candidatus Desulfobacula maris]